VPDLDRGFVACNKTNSVLVFDLKTLQVITTIKTEEKPDALVYEPATGLVVAFTHNKSANVFSARDGVMKGSIPLGGGPEYAVSDGFGKVYVSLQDTNEVIEIDPQKLKLEHRWPVTSCEAATSLGIDRKSRRLFIGCHNLDLAVMDADNGHVLQSLRIGPGVDGTTFDPDTGLLFVSSGGDGTATVIRENDANHFVTAQVVKTKLSARTIALDPVTHRIYLPYAKRLPVANKPGEEERFEDGSFSVLELAPGGSR
jgi:DNA-binding beta-propeller fold protein YncE